MSPTPLSARPALGAIPFRIRLAVVGEGPVPPSAEFIERLEDALDRRIPALFDAASRPLLADARATPLAYTLVTSLLTEAERTVARHVLHRPLARLDVVLPFVWEDYVEALCSPEARREAAQLLGRSRRPVSLATRRLADEPDPAQAAARAREAFARHQVDHADVILIVAPQPVRRRESPVGWLTAHAVARGRPLVVVTTAPPYDLTVERGAGLSAAAIEGLDRFNRTRVDPENERLRVDALDREWFSAPEAQRLPLDARTRVRRFLLPFYSRAAHLAERHRMWYAATTLALFGLAPVAVGAGVLALVSPPPATAFLIAEAVLAGLMAVAALVGHRRRDYEHWVEAAFLAGRLRSATVFAACQLEPSRLEPSPYQSGAPRADTWTLRAFDEIWHRMPPFERPARHVATPLVPFVRHRWVGERIAAHRRAAVRAEGIRRALEYGVWAVTATAIIVALVAAARGAAVDGSGGGLVALAIVLPVVGAALAGYRAHSESVRVAARSADLAVSLEALDSRFVDLDDIGGLEPLLREVEDLLLRESQDRLVLVGAVRGLPS